MMSPRVFTPWKAGDDGDLPLVEQPAQAVGADLGDHADP
jgi:hypothetical protein